MRPVEAIAYHLSAVFPVLSGKFQPSMFVWKAAAFALCGLLAARDPKKFLWSSLFTLGTAPFLLFSSGLDFVSLAVRIYLQWMCAEITFRSLAVSPPARMPGWWIFPLSLLIIL